MTALSSVESSVITDWLKEDAHCWIAIATAFLQRYQRQAAIDRTSAALQFSLRDGPPTGNTFPGRFYNAGLRRIDYDGLALQVVLAAEAADPALRNLWSSTA